MSQHMKALAEANRVRLSRARLKREVLSGARTIPDILSSIPDYVEGMTVRELLKAQRRWGTSRTQKFLNKCAISETRKVRDLTDRQVNVIVKQLEHLRGALPGS